MAANGCDERLVFVDLETAGLEPWRPIMQVAAVAVTSSLRELETFEAKILFQEKFAAPGRLRKRNYSRELWQTDGRRAKDVATDFGAFLTRHATVDVFSGSGKRFLVAQLVAHHAEFDAAFLRGWFERSGLFFPGAFRVFCTLQRAAWLFHEDKTLTPPTDFKLGTLCQYFGVPLAVEEAHDALADVRATAELYRAITSLSQRNRAAA